MKKATRTALTSAAALGLLCVATPSHAQLPTKSAPQGMLQITPDEKGGSGGHILTSRMGGTPSARKILQALTMVSGEYFDKPLVVTRLFADQNDQNLQAAFTARLKSVPVHGVISVMMQGDVGQGTLLFDNAKTFTQSFSKLMTRQNGESGRAGKNAPPVQLTPQTAPDSSGQISLPPGFRITGAYKGTLDIAGPRETAMVMGATTACTRPELAAAYTGFVPVDFNDPRRALVDFINHTARKAGVPVTVKILDSRPAASDVGRAAYIRYSVQGGGKSMEGFGVFSISVIDANQAILYQSFISAPTATYQKEFPAMLRAWGTWSVNPSVFQERLMAAAGSMRGMSDIITSTNANRQQTYARVHEAWSDVIRDQSTWSNPGSGTQYKVSNTLTNGGGIPMVDGVPLQPVPLSGL